jgi:hypothetical protein
MNEPILPLAAGSRRWARFGQKWRPVLGGTRHGVALVPVVSRLDNCSFRERLRGLHRLDQDTVRHWLTEPRLRITPVMQLAIDKTDVSCGR